MTRERRRTCTLAALILGLSVLAGCSGGEGDEAAFTPVAGSDSAYCATYRAWKVYELDNGEAYDQPNPAALRRWWNEHLIAEETLLREAPSEIHAAVEVKVSAIRTLMTPLLEHYGFDLKRMEREATAAEKAVLDQPSPEVERAQAVQYGFEERCGTAPSPPPADVVFEAGTSSRSYCTALSALNAKFDEVTFSRFDPDVSRTLVTGDTFSKALDGLDAAAPPEIAADVQAETEWFRTRWSDVVERYGYDLRGIYLDGSPEDLAVFNRTHPGVVEHTSRTTAYEEQVCEG
jgi:hypothetical protein